MTAFEPTVVMRDVHVTYRVYEDKSAGLKQMVARGHVKRKHREIKAVRGVDMTLCAGESVGIIGANGSGKSTLLAAMTGLLPIESGSIRVRSRPRLLGVGAALRPLLSGRRNIIIGGLALGLSKKEIESRVDEIIEFTGLEEFVDLPMRVYSTGMRARLNFAIATASVPDILLIDEALAVGDEEFRQKSEQRINEIRSGAGTVVLVSHSMTEIEKTCDRAFWLDHGAIRASGPPEAVIAEYRESVASPDAQQLIPTNPANR